MGFLVHFSVLFCFASHNKCYDNVLHEFKQYFFKHFTVCDHVCWSKFHIKLYKSVVLNLNSDKISNSILFKFSFTHSKQETYLFAL